MNESFYRITLDIKSIQSQISLPIKQGDTSRGIYISLTDGGKPYVIAEKCFAIFKGNKSDGTEVGNNCYIENNRIVYPITKETVTSPGIVECEVSLYNFEGGLITTPRFTLVVDSRAVGGEQYKSSSEYTSLESFLSRVAEGETKLQQVAEGVMGFPIDDLYSHFGVSKSSYPYVLASWSKPILRVRFLQNFTIKENGEISSVDFWLGTNNVGTYEFDINSADSVCEAILAQITTVEKADEILWGSFDTSTKWYANTSLANVLRVNGVENFIEIPEGASIYELSKQISDVVATVDSPKLWELAPGLYKVKTGWHLTKTEFLTITEVESVYIHIIANIEGEALYLRNTYAFSSDAIDGNYMLPSFEWGSTNGTTASKGVFQNNSFLVKESADIETYSKSSNRYPSVRAFYNFVTNKLALKEATQNKVGAITDANSKDGVHYPTVQAVVNYVKSQGGSGSSDYDEIIADITERLDAIENSAGKEYTPLVETADYTFEETDLVEGLCFASLNIVDDVEMFKEGAVLKVTVGDTVDDICTVRIIQDELICGNTTILGFGIGEDTGEPYVIARDGDYLGMYYRATEGTYKVGISVEGVGTGGGGADINLLDNVHFEEKNDNDVYNAIAMDYMLMKYAQILMVVCDKLDIDFEAMLSLSGGESDG